MKRGKVIAAALAALLAGGSAGAQALVEWQELTIPGVCTLRIAVPQGWNARLARPVPGGAEVRIAPESGPRAEVTMEAPVPHLGRPVRTTGEIKAAVREMGEARLPGSAEKKLALERVEGSDGSGFFYSLTDSRPQQPGGEPRYLTQGIMAVGPLRLAVTVLAEDPGSAARAMALDLLRTAECVPAKAPRQ